MLKRNPAHFSHTRVKTSVLVVLGGSGGKWGRGTGKEIFCLSKSLRNKSWGNEFKGLSQTLPMQVQSLNYVSYEDHTLRTPDFHNKPLNICWKGGMAGTLNNLLHKESAMSTSLKINLGGFKCNGLCVGNNLHLTRVMSHGVLKTLPLRHSFVFYCLVLLILSVLRDD